MKNLHRSVLRSASAVVGTALLLTASSLSSQAFSVSESETLHNAGDDWSAAPQIQDISSTDLLESGSSSFSSLTANNPANTSIPAVSTSNSGLNDGLSIGNNSNFLASAYYGYNSGPDAKGNLIVGNELGNGGEVLTFNLNLANSAQGYSINTINTIAGWQDHASVANQNFSLQYSLVSDPTVFFSLTSVAYNPNDPTNDNDGTAGEISEVSLTDLGLNGVAALRFTFTADPSSAGSGATGTGIWLQEIDAVGAATVPEPGTWAMMALGLGAVVLFSLRRKTA